MIMYIKYGKQYLDYPNGFYEFIDNLVKGEGGDGAVLVMSNDYHKLYYDFVDWYKIKYAKYVDYISCNEYEHFLNLCDKPESNFSFCNKKEIEKHDKIFYEFVVDLTEET